MTLFFQRNRPYKFKHLPEWAKQVEIARGGVRVAYFQTIHAFGNGRRSYASEPIAKSVEWNCSTKRRRRMQREFQVTYFANNNEWRYLLFSCIL